MTDDDPTRPNDTAHPTRDAGAVKRPRSVKRVVVFSEAATAQPAPKRGRKPKGEAERKDTVLRVRLSGEDHSRLIDNARAAQLTESEYVRQALRGSRPSSSKTPRADVELVQQLVRVGVNLNQIAHQVNSTRGAIPRGLVPCLEQVGALLDQLTADTTRRRSR